MCQNMPPEKLSSKNFEELCPLTVCSQDVQTREGANREKTNREKDHNVFFFTVNVPYKP